MKPHGALMSFPAGSRSFPKFLQSRRGPVCLIIVSETCGHCRAMKPELDSLSRRISSKGLPSAAVVDIATAMQSEHPRLSNITAVPTIISMSGKPGSKVVSYSGDRTAQSLADFIEKTSKSVPSLKSSRRSSKKSRKRSTKKKRSKSKKTKKNRKKSSLSN